MSIKYKIFENKNDLYDYAADLYINAVRSNPYIKLGLATGSTPVELYKRLVLDYKKNNTDYSNVLFFNLDEYIGLPISNSQSYYYFMHDNLFNHINSKSSNINIPNGMSNNIDSEIIRYSNKVLDNNIDIQLLGVGSNGHIAFNEPNTDFNTKCHVVELTHQTRLDNSRFFNSLDEVPKSAITMGIYEIVRSKAIVLIACGKNKADAIYHLKKNVKNIKYPVTSLIDCENVIVLLDSDAASLIKE